ncbi:DUF1905 domain-containing protein [Aquimarina gracilis]|uniref:DUF1905 domain-containing protein n=1 Tax=Aquimarina gracilis TaxID=874422 RepID=A0ABU5ZWA2_9FLAO|nr:DUF1905 domain-containing protein [Aquimarina gracilis]MEB3346144.1 DUF1905 domain-containing protein [Aquimarina gracilis]
MPRFAFEQPILQLEQRKGGYHYLKIDADVVNQFEQKRATRLKCVIDGNLSYSCGLNHLGDGNFFIILANAKLKKLNKTLGDIVSFEIFEDPNPLGVEEPEVLKVLLEQDPIAKGMYNQLTDGKKRSLIFSIIKVKNIDLQVQKILEFLNQQKGQHNQRN